jgi:hypothetical protein
VSFTLPRSWLIFSRPSWVAFEGSAHRNARPFVMDGPVEVGYPPISRKFAMPPTTTKGGEVMSEVFMAGSDRCYGGNKSLPYVRQSLLTFRSPTPSPPPSVLGRQTTSPIASTHLPAHICQHTQTLLVSPNLRSPSDILYTLCRCMIYLRSYWTE